MIERYDPDHAPDAEEWLALEESERAALVEEYHREHRLKLPNARMHASIHAVVENQLAMEDQAIVRETLQRLMGEGLTRHDAVHAIGSALAEHIYNLLQSNDPPKDANEGYYAALGQLTAKNWRDG